MSSFVFHKSLFRGLFLETLIRVSLGWLFLETKTNNL